MKYLIEKKNLVRNVLITIYVLVVLGISATAKAQMNIFPIFVDHENLQTELFKGEITMTVDGTAYLVVSDQQVFQLASNIDLSEFNGLRVQVEGLELQHKVGPVVELASVDPLPGSSSASASAPVLVVFDISEVTE